MTNLYFEELQIGIRSAAGPYSLTKEEIIRFAKQYESDTPPHRRGARGTIGLWRIDGIAIAYVCDLHPALGSAPTALPGPDGIGVG